MATDIITTTILVQQLLRSTPTIIKFISGSLGIKEKDIEQAKDVGQLQVVVGEQIIKKVQDENIAGSPDAVADRLMQSWIVETRQALSARRKQCLSETSISFTIAISALTVGILLVFAGVILIFTSALQAGIVTSSSSIVTGIVCALAFKFNQQAHARLDAIAKEMNTLDNVYIATDLASHITDQSKRDKAIEDLINKIYPGHTTNP